MMRWLFSESPSGPGSASQNAASAFFSMVKPSRQGLLIPFACAFLALASE